MTLTGNGLDLQNANLGSGLVYSGGAFHASYNNIICRGNTSTGVSGIAFTSSKGTSSINVPSDCGFIQFHPYNVGLSSIGSNPSLGTSGESNKLVIGVNNDADDMIYLQTPGGDGLKHVVGTSVYDIITTRNISSQNVTSAKVLSDVYAGDGSNLEALQQAFSSIPKGVITSCRLRHGSHSKAIGWFLEGYGYDNAYGGWFISDYGTPSWVGVDNGNWHSDSFITSSNIGNQSVNYANSAGTVSWGNVSSKPSATGNATTPVYWNGSGFTNCTAYGSASVNYANSTNISRYMSCPDTRSTMPAPTTYSATGSGVSFDFKQSSVTGLSGYTGVMTFRPYSSSSDWTGGAAHQLGFCGGDNRLYHRTGTSSWSSTWNKIAYTTDIPSTVSWSNVTDKPSLVTNSYGSMLTINSWPGLEIVNTNRNNGETGLRVRSLDSAGNNNIKAYFGWLSSQGAYVYNAACGKYLALNDAGTPHVSGTVLLTQSNWSSYINPYSSSSQPGYTVSHSGWSYSRYYSGSNFWDIGTNQSAGGWGSNGGFGIRENGADNNGIYVKRNTSSYGKLCVGTPSGECSIGYYVGGSAKWTVGCSDGTNFGFYQGSSGGWKVTIDTAGSVYSNSDRHKKKDIQSIDRRSLSDLFDISDKLLKQFTWKDSGKKSYGFIAQQLEKYVPEAVTQDNKGVKSVSYDIAYAKILASIVNEIKKLRGAKG